MSKENERMKQPLFTIGFLLALQATTATAQTPESFFPTQVGNLWQYSGGASLWENWSILQDSVASDGYRYLYIRFPRTGEQYWWYRLDSTYSVYRYPGTWDDTLYRLASDSGDVWLRSSGPTFPYYSWVYDTLHSVVFGRATTIKVIRSGPFHPDSGGNGFYFEEQHLASGFGVIYHWEEPGNVAFLSACIVAGDTFGTIVSVRTDERIIPENFQLAQNYPNPFNPTTTIEFSLPTESDVRFSVYDVLGREIAVLLDERKKVGTHKVVFGGSYLPSGVYFARLKAQNAFLIRKMILLK